MSDTLRILAVEDDDIFVERLERHFAKSDARVDFRRATDGLEAQRWLQGGGESGPDSPCVILLDLRLPRMSGIEFLSWLRGQEQFAGVKVIVVTTSSSPTDRQQAEALHADAYVLKSDLRRGMAPLMEQITALYGADSRAAQQSILAVDDESVFQEMIERELTAGYRLRFAKDLASAKEALKENGFDCVLLDLQLPDGGGIDLLPEIVRLGVPVVILTGHGTEEKAVEAMKLGAEDYLVKRSIARGGIGRAISNAIEKFNLREQLKAREQEKDALIVELKQALEEIKRLEGMLSVCAQCKNIRNENGHWVRMEEYIVTHSDVEFSHGLCPDCYEEEMRKLKR